MPGKCLKHFLYSQVFPVYLQKTVYPPLVTRGTGIRLFCLSRSQAHTLRGSSDITLLPVTPNYHHFPLP